MARDKLLNGSKEQPPLWFKRFWNEEMAAFSLTLAKPKDVWKVREPIQNSAIVARIQSVPTRDTIEAAAAFRPETRDLLETWRLIWDRSFPEFKFNEKSEGRFNETSRATRMLARYNWLSKDFNRGEGAALTGKEALWRSAEQKLGEFARKWKTVDKATSGSMEDVRDYRLHVIDDAETIVAFRHLRCGFGVVSFHGELFSLAGHSSDGLPLFESVGRDKGWCSERLKDHPEYWFWPSFQKYMARRSIYAPDFCVAGALVADMAWQGYTHAFIKAALPKQGTWTLNLTNIRTIEEGTAALLALTKRSSERGFPLIVQEHLPFTHEQRIFVIDGKVVASVASDRHFCVADARKNRRLDDRLAVIHVPSIDQGEYDRGVTSHVVDRKLSAQFAGFARKIARDLKEDGHLDYVIDLGMTERGITAVEINTVHFAGPYCMEKKWITKAYDRRRLRTQNALDAAVKEMCPKMSNDPVVLAYAEKYREPHLIEKLLAREVKTQPQNVESIKYDATERLLVKAIIAAKLKETNHAK